MHRRAAIQSAVVLASAISSIVFIARTAFTVEGERYFTLFDDAMISMRYARNLAQGHGLLWNIGQPPVEGYTNFLWTLWMATLHLLPLRESKISLLVLVSGAVILIANLVVVYRVAERVAPDARRVPTLAAWFTALYYPLIYWTLRGMEVGVVTLLVSASVLIALRLRDAARRRDVVALAALMILGVLTRPDVVVPCAVIAVFAVLNAGKGSRRIVAFVLVGAIAATIALCTAFRLQYYGAPLPNTFYLKVTGSALGDRVPRGLIGLLLLDLLHLIVPVALAALGLRPRASRGSQSAAYLLAAIFAALCGYSVYVGGDAWETLQFANRYITPAMPGLLILSALGVDDLVAGRWRSSRAVAPAIGALYLLVAVATVAAPATSENPVATGADNALRIARAALVLTPVFALPLIVTASGAPTRRTRRAVAAALVVATWTAINGQPASVWLFYNAAYVHDDEWAARYGLALRSATSDDATIAVTWGGAIPYFSHRTTIDLLGKSDPVIATTRRQPSVGFFPGHDKWDYAYSIGRLQPDVVAELWHASEDDVRTIEAAGYRRVAPWVFIRTASTRIDAPAVREAACVMLDHDPFVLGSVQRIDPDLDAHRRRYCR
jgi:hypothetical protein